MSQRSRTFFKVKQHVLLIDDPGAVVRLSREA
jgi:hypothetical protein